ncbi:MAG: helix-turn-helix domain-containing protein [Candidatus Caldatribacteriota bacterium]|nr:helix-turn-helix domain-containing protein [Candidatus Caldatribacteriota bacterium]
MHKPIGNNYSLVFLSGYNVAVYQAGRFLKEVNIYDQFDKRLFVIDLIERYSVTKSKLAHVLNISRTSVDVWLELYRFEGQKALINSTKSGVGRRKGNRLEKKIIRPEGDKHDWAEKHKEERKNEEKEKRIELKKYQLAINLNNEKPRVNKDTEHFNDEFEEDNRFAGSFIYWGVSQATDDIMSLIYTSYGKYSTIFYLFIMMHVNKIGSIEQLKTIFKTEFGRLIGLKKLPNLPAIRSFLHEIVSVNISKTVIGNYFKNQIYKGLVSLWYLFIDGHFIPYTGKEKVHKNFHTQTGEMETGQNELFIHDIEGRIVYFDIQEGKGDMLSMIIEKSKEYAPYIGNITPLFIADKEIWGVEKFLLLSDCRFVTWEKNTDKEEINKLPDSVFSCPFTVNDIVYQVYETEKNYKNIHGKSICLRRLVIWNHQNCTRSVAVSNDSYEDSISLSFAMLNRWGKSENGFKHLGDRTNMHYNPLIEIEKLSENQQITNPLYYKLQKKLQHLKKELDKTERGLGKKELKINMDGSLRKNSARDDLQLKRDQLLIEIEKTKSEYKACPEKMNIMQQQAYKKYKVIETEGKRIWDFAEVIFWNTRKKLIAILKEYLPDERDLIPVLEAITKCRGIIKSTKDTVIVKLEPLERPKFRQAQIQFCRKLNEMGAKLDNGKRILFDVQTK